MVKGESSPSSFTPLPSCLLALFVMRKYIVNFDSTKLPKIETDFLVIGSGHAGLRAAIEASKHGDVIIITKDILRESSTRYAQGGIAVAMSEEDTIAAHVADTLKAGDDLCDEHAVRVMVEEGIPRVKELIKWGANFDQRGGQLGFTREAAHGRRRIIHARGDATGEETEEVLMTHATNIENVRVMEYTYAIDLLTQDNVCYGVLYVGKMNWAVSSPKLPSLPLAALDRFTNILLTLK